MYQFVVSQRGAYGEVRGWLDGMIDVSGSGHDSKMLWGGHSKMIG
jgi:hypothetical protein